MISYKPFLKLLIDKNIQKKTIIEDTGISKGTINRMNNKNNQYVSLEVIDKLCNYFKCDINDIIEYIPSETSNNAEK